MFVASRREIVHLAGCHLIGILHLRRNWKVDVLELHAEANSARLVSVLRGTILRGG